MKPPPAPISVPNAPTPTPIRQSTTAAWNDQLTAGDNQTARDPSCVRPMPSAADAGRQVVRDLVEIDELAREGGETLDVGEVGGEPE